MVAEPTYRSLIFAALYVPQRPLSREEATTFYRRVAPLFPDIDFKYEEAVEGRPFAIRMREQLGKRSATILIDTPDNNTIRLLVEQAWPKSSEVACQSADAVKQAFAEIISSDVRLHLVEARVRSQVSVRGQGQALESLQFAIMGEKAERLKALGNLSFFGVKYEIAPTGKISDGLSSPAREVQIEPLREDGYFFYIDVMSKWGRQILQPGTDPSRMDFAQGPLDREELTPSRYLQNVIEYLENQVASFLEANQ